MLSRSPASCHQVAARPARARRHPPRPARARGAPARPGPARPPSRRPSRPGFAATRRNSFAATSRQTGARMGETERRPARVTARGCRAGRAAPPSGILERIVHPRAVRSSAREIARRRAPAAAAVRKRPLETGHRGPAAGGSLRSGQVAAERPGYPTGDDRDRGMRGQRGRSSRRRQLRTGSRRPGGQRPLASSAVDRRAAVRPSRPSSAWAMADCHEAFPGSLPVGCSRRCSRYSSPGSRRRSSDSSISRDGRGTGPAALASHRDDEASCAGPARASRWPFRCCRAARRTTARTCADPDVWRRNRTLSAGWCASSSSRK